MLSGEPGAGTGLGVVWCGGRMCTLRGRMLPGILPLPPPASFGGPTAENEEMPVLPPTAFGPLALRTKAHGGAFLRFCSTFCGPAVPEAEGRSSKSRSLTIPSGQVAFKPGPRGRRSGEAPPGAHRVAAESGATDFARTLIPAWDSSGHRLTASPSEKNNRGQGGKARPPPARDGRGFLPAWDAGRQPP